MLKMKADSYTSYSRALMDGESCCIASCILENGTHLSFVDNYWRDGKDNRYLEVDRGAYIGFIRLSPTLPMGDRQTAVESLIAGLDVTTQGVIIEHIPEWSQYLGLSELEVDDLVGKCCKNNMIDRSRERFREIEAEPIGCKSVNDNIACIGCIFSKGDTQFDNTPQKSYCAIYSRENSKQKPKGIYFDGEQCKYRKTKQEQPRRDTE